MNRFPDRLFYSDWLGADQIYINLARLGAYSELIGKNLAPSTCPGLFTEQRNGGAIVSLSYKGETFSCGMIQSLNSAHGIKYEIIECGKIVMRELKSKLSINRNNIDEIEVRSIVLGAFRPFLGFEKMSNREVIFIEGDQREVLFPPFQHQDELEELSRGKRWQTSDAYDYRGRKAGEKYFYEKLN